MLRDKIQSGAAHSAVNALAGLVFVALALTSFHVAGFVFGCLILLVVGRPVRVNVVTSNAAQIAILAGTVVLYHRAVPHQPVPLILATASIAGLAMAVPHLASITYRPVIDAVGLAGYRPDRTARWLTGALHVLTAALIAVAGVGALTSWSPWPVAIAGLALASAAAVLSWGSGWSRRRRTRSGPPWNTTTPRSRCISVLRTTPSTTSRCGALIWPASVNRGSSSPANPSRTGCCRRSSTARYRWSTARPNSIWTPW